MIRCQKSDEEKCFGIKIWNGNTRNLLLKKVLLLMDKEFDLETQLTRYAMAMSTNLGMILGAISLLYVH